MRSTERSFYLGVIAVLSLILFIVRACDKPAKCNKTHCDNTVKTSVIIKRDTIEVEKRDSSNWHKPKQALSSLQAQKELNVFGGDSLVRAAVEAPESYNRDSLAVADYYILKAYSDTNQVEGGEVIVENKVYMNRLALQRVITNIRQKTINEERVVTNSIREGSKGQLYAGIIGQGQKSDPLTAFGGQFLWKTKKDKVWSISILYGKGGQVVYQAGHLFKISFR